MQDSKDLTGEKEGPFHPLLNRNVYTVNLENFFYFLLYLLNYTSLSTPISSFPSLIPSPMTPILPITQEILSFSPSYVDPCMSLLGFSLFWVVNGRLVFLCFISKATYEYVYIIFVFLITSLSMAFF